MNKFRIILLMLVVAASALFLATCKKEKEKDKLSVTPVALEFYADADNEKFVDVTTNVNSWQTSKSDNWIGISEVSGGFRVTAEKYTDTSRDRTGVITVKAGKAEPVSVSVKQIAAVQHTLSVSPTTIPFEAGETGAKTASVTTSAAKWEATPVSADWLTSEKLGNTLKLTVNSNNTSLTQRSVSIIVTAGNAEPVTVAVTQAGMIPNTLSVNPMSITFAANETAAKTTTITTNVASWDATTAVDWLTLEKQNNTLRVTPKNLNTGSSPRTADISVTAGTATPVTVSVTQVVTVPNTLSVNPTSIMFAINETGIKTTTITTNAAIWDATTTAGWMTLEKQGNTLRITVNALNIGTTPRTADVTVTAGNAEPVIVPVTQAATPPNTLSVNPVSINYATGETGDKTTTVTTDAASWDAKTTADWLTLEKQSNTLRVTVNTLNTGASQRVAGITVTGGNAEPVTVTVTQAVTEANTLSVNPASISFAEDETNTKTTTITTNAASWDATTTADWLTLEKQGNTLRVTPKSLNTGASQRSANITVTAGTANPVTVPVTQAVTTITIDANKIPGTWKAVKCVEEDGTTITYPILGNRNILFSLKNDGTFHWDVQNSVPKVDVRGTWTYSAANRTITCIGTMTMAGFAPSDYNESFQIEELTDDLLVVYQETGYNKPTWTFNRTTESSGPSFYDIVNSNYTATAVPYPGSTHPSSWNGQVIPQTDQYGQAYGVTRWANSNYTIFLNYNADGSIVLDDKYAIGETSTHWIVPRMFIYIGTTLYVINQGACIVAYNKSTRTLTFPTTVTVSGVAYTAWIGIVGQRKTTSAFDLGVTGFSRNQILVLTPMSSSSSRSNLSPEKTPSTSIVIDETQLERVQLGNEDLNLDTFKPFEKRR